MAQVLEFRLPDLGEGLTEAEIVRWLVAVGDVVTVDQPVVEVETAKAMVEVPCPYGGVVTARFGEEGAELPVGAPLLTVAVGAGDDAGSAGGPAGSSDAAGASGEPSGESSGNVLVGYGTGAPAARRRRIRPAHQGAGVAARPDSGGRAVASAQAAASPGTRDGSTGVAAPQGTTVRIDGGRPRTRPEADGPVPVISPLVRRLARENGLDLRQLTGSGPDGLIMRADVESALRAAESVPEPAAAAASGAAVPRTVAQGAERIPLRGVRGAVADKLSRSRQEIPDATCWVDADATELMAARAAMNGAGGPKISVLALLARICTAALARYPELNSTVDLQAREIVRLPEVHLGFAAQTERGLVVPVVKDAHDRSAESLTEEFARLTQAAREGTLTPADLTGGTFTLNNYGVFGVDGSTPIINHPEAAMLGVGRIVPKPWVHRGELAVRQVVQLSLTFDHRVCDGGTAGGFLRYVADCVEQPSVLLRTL
ncbi:dihydrolipoamide acetyltransferase family protein [Streptomyces sp. HNM0663]|uniref:Dihydrolipoamide acetyltransferase component of pyruvate dehydrogenase complex n=1 Tax=Streptomyces chengmaiensis TaxID=3040919 RepID=A0ABT6HQL4_9ACTN|nr:dihydrolipoamide acetyltransferase family protein [Streptomyces chengmaiensis]MDH2391016.1 dihydrolipoamide acetyltransferase family protein [Streptomyces chengmaiensis]